MEPSTIPSRDVSRLMLRAHVRGGYDFQKLRIMFGNRIVAQVYAKMGRAPSQKKEDMENEEAIEVLDDLRKEYGRITDGVTTINAKTFQATPLISSFAEFSMIQNYMELLRIEERAFKAVGTILDTMPIYSEFLYHIKGIGPLMAGALLSEVDIQKARYVSSIWRFAGLTVEADGKGTSRRAEHLVEWKYTDKDGEEATRKGISYNPFLKTKLLGVLAGSFIRTGSPYRKIYDDYKVRKANDAAWSEETKKHIDLASRRYMIKMFLVDFYQAACIIEGKEMFNTYSAEKLNRVHSKPSPSHDLLLRIAQAHGAKVPEWFGKHP